MPRYFIEVSYNGAKYSGFQIQKNAVTIQSEVEKALAICFRQNCFLTGASRTDAGVHALQNFFHFDSKEELSLGENEIVESEKKINRILYSLNSILPYDIVIKKIIKVAEDAHCRFDAINREYKYQIYQQKNPFYKDIAYFYPYKIDFDKLQQAADIILHTQDFASFSKQNTQVSNFICFINKSQWYIENDIIIYNVAANRFLRGMVRGLVGTMLQVGTGKISIQCFHDIITNGNNYKANFSIPPQGLFLIKVKYL